MLPTVRRQIADLDPFFDSPRELLGEWMRLLNGDRTRQNSASFLATEVVEYGDRYCVYIDVPGVKKEDIDLSFEDKVLTVKVKRSSPEKPSEAKVLYNSRWTGETSMSISLPMADGNINAELKDGVLILTAQKQPEKQAKKIEIN